MLGELLRFGDRDLVIRRADGSEEGIPLAEVHLAKPVPPPPTPRGRRAQPGS